MPLISAEDLRTMIPALGGVDFTFGLVTVQVLLRKPDVELFRADEEELVGRSVTVLAVSEDLVGLVAGQSCTVAGESMKVHRIMAESDGSVTRVVCKKA
jgi:hypothetical protein